MAEKYPKDRFDTAPESLQRVGAHRSPRRRGSGWIGFLWALLAVAVLVGLGVLGLFIVNGNVNFSSSNSTTSGTPSAPAQSPTSSAPAPAPSHTPSHTPSPTPTPEPTIDPRLHVTVLNGTPARGLAAGVSKTLTADGWSVKTVGNASRGDFTQTVVYYSDPANKEAALGLVKSLTGAQAKAELSQTFAGTSADLTVVVGSDYHTGTQ
jgi:cytoskeletal protein RodZ